MGVGPAVGGGDDQTRMQCAEMESAVESIGEGGEVVGRVFSESECMVTPAQAGLELVKQASPSENTVQPGARLDWAHCPMALRLKPETGVSLMRSG